MDNGKQRVAYLECLCKRICVQCLGEIAKRQNILRAIKTENCRKPTSWKDMRHRKTEEAEDEVEKEKYHIYVTIFSVLHL